MTKTETIKGLDMDTYEIIENLADGSTRVEWQGAIYTVPAGQLAAWEAALGLAKAAAAGDSRSIRKMYAGLDNLED